MAVEQRLNELEHRREQELVLAPKVALNPLIVLPEYDV